MEQVITMVPEMTIGLDLGDRFTHGCRLDANALVQARFRFPTTKDGLAKAFAAQPPARVVLEVGTHSPWLSRWLEARGHEVIVANPREVASISRTTRKNDRADAEQLARLGRSDPKLLHPIRHRGARAQRDRARLATRRRLVAIRASLVTQARGLAKALGVRLPRSTTAAFVQRVQEAGFEELFPGMGSLLRTIAGLGEEIRQLDRELAALSKAQYPETALLRRVPGVGPITALTYVLAIEDPARFAKSRRIGSYLGLRPKQRDSGKRSRELSISKEGDRELRMLLVECAQWILARGPDSELKRFGERLATRGGRATRKKAVVALARKLAVVLHHLWQTGEVYQPFPRVQTQSA